MAKKIDREILIGFLEEAMGYLPAIRQGLEEYLTDRNRADSLEQAHRLMHTIKGASSMVGFAELSHIAHSVEETLNAVLARRYVLDEEAAWMVFATIDEIEGSLNALSDKTLHEAAPTDDDAVDHEISNEVEMSSSTVFESQPADSASGVPRHDADGRAEFTAPNDNGDDAPEADGMSAIDPEMLEIFSMEAEDHLRVMSVGLAALDKDAGDREALQEVRRSIHTLKGAAGVVGFRTATLLSHRMEDLLDRLYEGRESVTPEQLSLLLATTDTLESLTHGAAERSVRDRVEALYAAYAALLGQAGVVPKTTAEEDMFSAGSLEHASEESIINIAEFAAQAAALVAAPDASAADNSANQAADGKARRAAGRVVRVPLARLDDLVKLISELVISRTVLEQRMSDLGREVTELQHSNERLRHVSTKFETEYEASSLGGQTASLSAASSVASVLAARGVSATLPGLAGIVAHTKLTPVAAQETHGFDALEFDRYTDFHRLTRELAEASSDINAVGNELENLLGDFDSILTRQRRLTSEIQERLMRVRMVPLATMVTRLHRTVRVVADQERKQVDLIVEGENIELDTTVIDQMADPLLHALRNAVSHGIEVTEQRRLLGKNDRGLIRLRAYHEGSEVVIQISDDGSGIDPSALRAKAITGGFFSSAEAAAMTDKDALSLIFLPGLSTAKEISEVSGRGIGMDIVRDYVNKLQGTLTVDSTPGHGATFTIRLPMTLAVTRALLVKANQETFAVQLSSVKQLLRVEREEVERLSAEPVIRAGGKVYPMIRLGAALNLKQPQDATLSRLPVLILGAGENQVALVVDQLIEGREIVIKSLGNHLRRVQGIMGATLLGDGRVIPILNPVDLVGRKVASASAQAPTPRRTAEVRRVINVMVVDDSPSVRRVTSNLIKSAGWQFTTAKDGLDALEVLQNSTELPGVILLDVEMPRMDGYELLATLKRHDAYRHIPVVMVTSRTGEKHRRKGLDFGASEYLSKPYQDDILLGIIRKLAK